MSKEENAVKAIEYLSNWLEANRNAADTPQYPMYEYMNDVLDRVDEMFEIYRNGKLSSMSTNEYLASFQKDYI